MNAAVPTFYLYGEPRRSVDPRFVHVEPLDDRTRPSGWTIRPHAHADLNHVFLVERGGGGLRADAETLRFDAPCLVLVPAGVVHGFDWDVESSGSVVTVASGYLADLAQRDGDLGRLFEAAAVLDDPAPEIGRGVGELGREFGWAAPGHRAAVEALLLSLLVAVLRQVGARRADCGRAHGRDAALVARYRARVEARFRRRETVEAHARALGVGARRLRQACAAVARQSPAEILDQRAVLEAKRILIYGTLSVTEAGEALGFEDPAYFSRFFRRHAGLPPGAFRRGRSREEDRGDEDHGGEVPQRPGRSG